LQNLGSLPRWEVVNAGIPGTDTWQHEIVLEQLLDTLHPQAVVLGLYVNDVAPSYDPGKGHALELTNTWSKRLAYLLKKSSLVTWFSRGYNVRALAIAENHRTPIMDLLADLSAAYRLRRTTLFIPWDGHNGAAANQVIAARLAPISYPR
jgi:hypothetical protein